MSGNSIDSLPPSLSLELIQKVIFSVADALKNGGWKWVSIHESRDTVIVLLKSSRSLKEYGEKQLYQNLFITSPEALQLLSKIKKGDQ